MKKSFAILFLIGCSFVNHAQQYFPFIEEGKTWAELNVFQPGFPDPPFTQYNTRSFKFEGDTTFEGNSWKKLFVTTNDPEFESWQLEFCFYREQDRKVYRYCDPMTGEEMIYDFSLALGDSIYIVDGQPFDYWIHVIEVDSIEVSGEMRKRFHFDDPAEVWIEGLGSTYMPFDPIFGQFILGGGLYSLLCVNDNSGLVYQDPAFSACFIDTTITAVNYLESPEYQVRIFSQLPDRKLRVSISGKEGVFSRYHLSNMNGALARQGEFTGNDFTIDNSGLKPGIYILRLTGENAVFSSKVEIIR
jgi:hypothetical protein